VEDDGIIGLNFRLLQQIGNSSLTNQTWQTKNNRQLTCGRKQKKDLGAVPELELEAGRDLQNVHNNERMGKG
jgi:hypothetical protein